MSRYFLCVVCIVCVAAFSRAVFAEDNAGRQLLLTISIGEETSEADRPKILAEPSIATIAGRPFSFVSGGTVKPKTGEGDLEIGTRITGNLKRLQNGMVEVTLKTRVGNTVTQEDNPDTDLVRTEIVEIRTVMRLGETKRLNCSSSQWCTIRVEGVE